MGRISSVVTLCAAAALVSALSHAAPSTRQVGAATLENVPEIPVATRVAVQQYQNYRAALFQDWLADGSLLIATRFGVTVLLVLVPVVMVFGLSVYAISGTFIVMAAAMVVRRWGEYAFIRPGREMLFSKVDKESKYKAKNVCDVAVYRLDGAVFFGVAQRFLDELTAVADVRVVILRLSGVQHLDATGARALRDMAADLTHRQITVLLKGAGPRHLKILREVGVVGLVGEAHVFDDLPAAVGHAREHLATRDGAARCQVPAPD